ncbi:MAG: hypothetical protein NTV92_02355, partial [Candidatus Bipolaricaulota bacterium]|nr:hypothetical protein [Candidatus Bipolaricaulota bacterium]
LINTAEEDAITRILRHLDVHADEVRDLDHVIARMCGKTFHIVLIEWPTGKHIEFIAEKPMSNPYRFVVNGHDIEK